MKNLSTLRYIGLFTIVFFIIGSFLFVLPTQKVAFATSTAAAPTITSLSPASGPVGTQVTITGTGFNLNGGCITGSGIICNTTVAFPSNTVNFGTNTTITNLYSTDTTSLTFTVPAFTHPSCLNSVPACAIASAQITPGTYYVWVTNNNGISNAVQFSVTGSTTGNSFTITPTSGQAPLSVTANVNLTTDQTISGCSYNITWGDGTKTVFLPPGTQCSQGLTRQETHTYAAAGTYTATLTPGTGSVLTATVTVTGSTSSLAINTSSPLPNGQLGASYATTITGSGGSGSYSWSIQPNTLLCNNGLSCGSLPPGLTLSQTYPPCASTNVCPSQALISGTPTTAGTYTFGLTLTSGSQSVSKQFSLTVGSSTSTAPTITSLSPTSGAVGTQVTITGTGFNANGGCTSTSNQIVCTNVITPPNTVNFGPNTTITNLYSTDGTTLTFIVPSQVNCSSTACTAAQITPGTYSVSVTNNRGTSNAVQFTVTDSTSSVAINTSSPLPNGQVGASYATTITGSGGVASYVWTQLFPPCAASNNCSLPPGLTLSQTYPPCAASNVCPSQALISGTPTTAGTYTFGLTLTSGSQSVSKQFSLTVEPSNAVPPPTPVPTPTPAPEPTPLPPTNNIKPIGWLDSISSDGMINGWALDKNHPDQSIEVDIYFDGPAGVGQNELTTTANVSRPDVDQVMQVSGDHGFSAQIPSSLSDGKAHTAYVYAVDSDDSSGALNAQLYGSPRMFTFGTSSSPRHPRGTLVIDPSGTVFFLGTTLRYAFPSPDVFFSWGNKFSYIVLANDGDLAMPVGPLAQKKP